MSRDLNKAHPRLKAFAEELIKQAKELLNIDVFVVEVDRPVDVQMAYYAQGRESLGVVNRLRQRAGLPPITEKENKNKITWTMASKHIVNLANDTTADDFSRAIDFGIRNKGKYDGSSKADVNKDNLPDYYQLGALAKTIDRGIIWGGDWKNKDLPHYELPEEETMNFA